MNLGKQKKLAARALGVSKKRVKFDASTPENKKSLKEIISRDDVRALLEDKVISKEPKKGNSRTRANHILAQKKKGRRQGQGSRKGTANARHKEKDKWMTKIRALRAMLKTFKDADRLDTKTYRNLYRKSKGNFFRSKRHLGLYIEQNDLLKEVKESGSKK
jgi:large subunit ribosomal protein L19e